MVSRASELETRSRREETMRVLRWAAELAVSEDAGHANLGVYELNALADSELLDDSQALFVVTAAQKNAAEGLTKRAAAKGESVRPAVRKIAGARVLPAGAGAEASRSD